MEVRDSDDETATLSSVALQALQEFCAEKAAYFLQEQERACGMLPANKALKFEEDWQLSQFWYDDRTSDALSDEAIRIAGHHGSIACVSCPTLYGRLREKKPHSLMTRVLEFDQRFQAYGDDFIYYDYRDPLNVPSHLCHAFDVVVADPPFLSEECLMKTAQTIKYIARNKIIICTGAVMEEIAMRELDVHPCQFTPRHAKSLGNEFKTFANYDFDRYVQKL